MDAMTAAAVRFSRLAACCIIVAVAISTPPVRAQDAATDLPPEDRWTFVVAPYLWAISLDGNAEVKGVEADIDVPFSDAVKDLSLGAMLLVDARRGRFGIAANGVFTRVSPEDEVGPLEIDVTTDLAQLGVGPTTARSNGATASRRPGGGCGWFSNRGSAPASTISGSNWN